MKKKAFIPVSALIGVMLLTLVATMTLFVAEPDMSRYAQTAPDDRQLICKASRWWVQPNATHNNPAGLDVTWSTVGACSGYRCH